MCLNILFLIDSAVRIPESKWAIIDEICVVYINTFKLTVDFSEWLKSGCRLMSL